MKLKLLNDFRKDEQGGILAFYLIMFMLMMVGGGMSIDFMRHEIKREGLQDALDRGVLAAAGQAESSAPTSGAEIAAAEAEAITTVRSYILASGFDPDVQGVVVTPDITPFSQRVDADANFDVDTYFLRLTGIDTLSGVAAAGAAVSVSKIELSLVVDISGSMGGTKIVNLRAAATEFSTLMLQGERDVNTTISLIPFSGQVGVPDSIISTYNYNRYHTYSNCIDFEDADFETLEMSTSSTFEQTHHWRANWMVPANTYWCPPSDLSILPFSNTLADLTAAITGLRATGNTGSEIGMKWGTALLDPSSQTLVDNLISQTLVEPSFSGRPSAYDDEDTLKFIILMTDGNNTGEYRMKDARYDTYEVTLDLAVAQGVAPNYNAPQYVINNNGDNTQAWPMATPQRTADYWDDDPTHVATWTWTDLVARTSPNNQNTQLQNICTAAKDEGVIIFTIGYDVGATSVAATQMKACASSIGHFYNVETADLSAAFSSIYQTIQKLKLVN